MSEGGQRESYEDLRVMLSELLDEKERYLTTGTVLTFNCNFVKRHALLFVSTGKSTHLIMTVIC